MKRLFRSCLSAAALVAVLAVGAVAVPHYTVQVIDTPGFSGWAINNSGQVAGRLNYDSGGWGAAYWDGTTMHDLGSFGSSYANVQNMNETGQIVGSLPSASRTVFRWDNGVSVFPGNEAWDINNSGRTVGYYGGYPCVWDGTTITYLSLTENGVARAINDPGMIVGDYWHSEPGPLPRAVQRACLWSGTERLDLGTLGGNSSAYDINNKGQVAGIYREPNDDVRSFLWENGVMHSIGTLGIGYEWAQAVNESGQIVGQSTFCGGFFAENGVMYDLNTLLPADSPWQISIARDINDRGQIVCSATIPGQIGRTLILTPVPEPSSCTVLAASLVWLACALRRRRR